MKNEPSARAHVDQLVNSYLAAGVAVLGASVGIDTADEGMNSSADRLQFLFSNKTGASAAQYSVVLRVRH